MSNIALNKSTNILANPNPDIAISVEIAISTDNSDAVINNSDESGEHTEMGDANITPTYVDSPINVSPINVSPINVSQSVIRNKKPIVISIEGIIGAGKSTLLNILNNLNIYADTTNVCCIQEPVDEWKRSGALKEYYDSFATNNADIIRLSAYKFQTYTFVTRVNKIISEYKKNPNADIYILERCIYSDRYFFVEMLYHSGRFSSTDYKMYNDWWEMWKLIMPFDIDAFIYLKPSVDECMSRVKSRDRAGENQIQSDYQCELEKYHDNYFAQLKTSAQKSPLVLHLNTNINFRDSPPHQQEIIAVITHFIKHEILGY